MLDAERRIKQYIKERLDSRQKRLMGYYADYRPKFPEKSSGDFLIAYDHFKGKITISANTAAILIIKKYTSFQDLLCELSNME